MYILMLGTYRGSEDAHEVKQFEEGQCYEVADTLARSFIRDRKATEVSNGLSRQAS